MHAPVGLSIIESTRSQCPRDAAPCGACRAVPGGAGARSQPHSASATRASTVKAGARSFAAQSSAALSAACGAPAAMACPSCVKLKKTEPPGFANPQFGVAYYCAQECFKK